jgi:hypothetical protein
MICEFAFQHSFKAAPFEFHDLPMFAEQILDITVEILQQFSE